MKRCIFGAFCLEFVLVIGGCNIGGIKCVFEVFYLIDFTYAQSHHLLEPLVLLSSVLPV